MYIYTNHIYVYISTTNIYTLYILYIHNLLQGFFVVHDLILHNQKSIARDFNNSNNDSNNNEG